MTTSLLALLKGGDHVVMTSDCYRRTRQFVSAHLGRFGVTASLVEPGDLTALEKAMSATMRDVFAHVARDPSQPTNTILVAGRRPLTTSGLQPSLPGGEVYTDDRAPVEWLIDASIVQVAADGHR